MLLVSLLPIACSDYEDGQTVGEQPVDVLSRFSSEGKAWLSLNIALPHSMTRTDFADGEEAEYAIRTLTLVLFHGLSTDTEDQLTVASIYNVDYTPHEDTHNQITNHSMTTFQITDRNIRNSDKLYMLAIANASQSIEAGTTFSDVKTTVLYGLTTTINGNAYYVMTNAPLASANDGTGSVTTLAEIDPSRIAMTEADAIATPAGYIYLERVAVKVTTSLDKGLDMHIKGNTNIDFIASDFHYSLFNFNMNSNLIRQMDDIWLPYNLTAIRFVEQAPLPNQKYRTYWGRDINYESEPSVAGIKGWNSMGENDYCAENTFDVAHMKDDCTTSVLVRLQLNNGGDFYTTNVTGSDIVFQPPGYELSENGTSASSSFSRTRSNQVTYDGMNIATIDDYLRTWLMQTNKGLRDWVNTYAAGEVNHVVITLANDATSGTATVSSVTQTAHASGAGATAFEALNLVSYFANNIALKFYDNGYCYYRVLIRHFDDTQTPWSSAASMTDNTTAQVYNGDAARYLGRYGVVRNNWYNISIKSVTHIGSPIIPALTDDADDKVEQLLNTTLTISGWEKHEQNL